MLRAAASLTLIVVVTSGLLAQRPVQRPALPGPQTSAPYFPDRFEWQRRKPDDVGMDGAAVDQAVKSAIASETPDTRDLMLSLATTFGHNEPFDTPIGPVKPRAPANGLIVRHGYIVAEW